eukprot:392284-Prymnesium_polylepis.1
MEDEEAGGLLAGDERREPSRLPSVTTVLRNRIGVKMIVVLLPGGSRRQTPAGIKSHPKPASRVIHAHHYDFQNVAGITKPSQ